MTELTIDQALQQGMEAHKAGQVQEADRLYTAILKAQPKHPDANHNMGVLAVGVGKVEQALPFFKVALEVNPSTAQFWLSYIDALIRLNKLADAKAVLDQAKSKGAKSDGFAKLEYRLKEADLGPLEANQIATEPQPKQPNISDNLKLDQALKLAGKKAKEGLPEEATRIYQNILVKFPKNKRASDGLKALAGKPVGEPAKAQDSPQDQLQSLMALYNKGQLSLVVEHAQAHTKQYPESFAVWNLMGISAAQIGQLDQAILAFKRVLAIKPDDADAYNNIGNPLRKQGKLEEAIEAYNKALAIKPDYAEAYYNMGVTLQEQGKLEEAIEAYNKALAIKPDYPEAYNNMGNALQEQGKLEEAIDSYNKALTIKPNHYGAHRNLSSAIQYKPNNPQVGAVESLLKQAGIHDSDRCQLLYTRAKMNEDLGNFKESYKNYIEGGALRKKLLDYDLAHDQLLFKQIKVKAEKINEIAFDTSSETKLLTPIFILGMPRSGTTLIEQIISCHSEVQAAGEMPFIGRWGGPLVVDTEPSKSKTLADFRKSYLCELDKVSDGRRLVTDKMPQNFLYIGLILKAFPEAKIIHVKRDPAATCWSNFKHYFQTTGLRYSYDLNDVVNYFKLYQDLMEFWNERHGSQIYSLDYDKLTIDQELETRKLVGHLELVWEGACLSPQKNKRNIKTLSQQQVRKKVYTGSSQAWRKFEPFLAGVFDRLQA